VDAHPPRPLLPKVGVARLRGGISKSLSLWGMRGGRATTFCREQRAPPAENKEPPLAENNGGMMGMVEDNRVTKAMRRGGQITSLQCYHPLHVRGLVQHTEAMQVRSGSSWRSNGVDASRGEVI
jgi:hypothetical protein